MYSDLVKVIKTLESCKNLQQFLVAINMFKAWKKKHLPPFYSPYEASVLIGTQSGKQMDCIANKFGYQFRIGWVDFFHNNDAMQEQE